MSNAEDVYRAMNHLKMLQDLDKLPKVVEKSVSVVLEELHRLQTLPLSRSMQWFLDFIQKNSPYIDDIITAEQAAKIMIRMV